ncbi:hypothetical protein MTY414_77820 [Mycolicibacterium mageritense]|nr:hypothetical protein MTY414_77820 [Mycolicibacterium mageritense]
MSLRAMIAFAVIDVLIVATLGVAWVALTFGPPAVPIACVAGVVTGWALRVAATAWRRDDAINNELDRLDAADQPQETNR